MPSGSGVLRRGRGQEPCFSSAAHFSKTPCLGASIRSGCDVFVCHDRGGRPAYNAPLFRQPFRQEIALIKSRKSSAARSYIDPFTAPEIKRLVSEFGSPLLIIDCQRVREQYRNLHKALPGVDLHYAQKPLPHPAVVATIVELGGW